MNNLLEIPSQFMTIHYEPSRIPGVANQGDLNLGANCQVFAYALLNFFNKKTPQLRSSELWDDKVLIVAKVLTYIHRLRQAQATG